MRIRLKQEGFIKFLRLHGCEILYRGLPGCFVSVRFSEGHVAPIFTVEGKCARRFEIQIQDTDPSEPPVTGQIDSDLY